MLTALLHSSCIAEYLNLAEFSYRYDISNRRLPSGQGPSLVKNYSVDLASFLKLIPSLDQDPVLGALARPNQQGCWSGDSERARTRDNHHRDKGQQRESESDSCEEVPEKASSGRYQYDRWDEVCGDSVG